MSAIASSGSKTALLPLSQREPFPVKSTKQPAPVKPVQSKSTKAPARATIAAKKPEPKAPDAPWVTAAKWGFGIGMALTIIGWAALPLIYNNVKKGEFPLKPHNFVEAVVLVFSIPALIVGAIGAAIGASIGWIYSKLKRS